MFEYYFRDKITVENEVFFFIKLESSITGVVIYFSLVGRYGLSFNWAIYKYYDYYGVP